MIERIRRAEYMIKFLNADEIKDDLQMLEMAIEETWRYMREIGVTDICKRCLKRWGVVVRNGLKMKLMM